MSYLGGDELEGNPGKMKQNAVVEDRYSSHFRK